ncbi:MULTISPECIES: hypothetical protein [unclassified Streptomyces]|uniref:hypothetical protein n=1 Tax=unclassified Streptomyces TaxID=2593676 RepID=UPI000B0A01E5|nr:hypothetical protein [Streptomyces sp. TSRI0281]
MATTALRIGVVVGSIAGCAMAVAGIRAGADVTVYERSDGELQDRGFGIVIPPPLHEELVAAGYLDAAMPTAPVASRIWVTAAGAALRAGVRTAGLRGDPVQLGPVVAVVAREHGRGPLPAGAARDRGRARAVRAGGDPYRGRGGVVRHRRGSRRARIADPSGEG